MYSKQCNFNLSAVKKYMLLYDIYLQQYVTTNNCFCLSRRLDGKINTVRYGSQPPNGFYILGQSDIKLYTLLLYC